MDDPKVSDSQASVADQVFEQVRQVLPPDAMCDLELETSLYEIGLDSVARMDVVNRLEEAFKIRFAEDDLYEMETCSDLIECVQRTLDGKSDARPHKAQPGEAVEKQVATEEIPAEHYEVDKFAECVALEQRLAAARAIGYHNPYFRVNERVSGVTATIDDCPVVSFASFDYLGMARDPKIVAAATEALNQFGTSASASRLVGGNISIVEDLDRELASFLGTEAAAVFPSGYGTNTSLLGHLFGEGDLILYDELAHNSIEQGSTLSKAQRRPFPHNDYQFVDQLLGDIRGRFRRVVLALESIYSMDGDFPDLPRFIEVKRRHKALLYVDEAHSVGVMGNHGRGICEHFGVDPADGDLWMGTISKALGSGGGYIAGTASLMQYLKYTTPAMVFATGISPANAAAALASLRLIQDEPERVARLRDRSTLFLQLAKAKGLNTGNSNNTPVIPAILGDSMQCVQVSYALLEKGINALPILYPAVPENATRIRFFITANHTEEQIRHAVDSIADLIDTGSAA